MEIEGESALVTGGAVRIGRAICKHLASAGCRVVIHCHRSVAEARELCAQVERDGGTAQVVEGGLDTEADCTRVFEKAEKAFGPLGILVNNASTFDKTGLPDMTQARVLAEFMPTLLAPITLSRLFAASVRQRCREGDAPAAGIVNLLDRRVAGHDPAALPYTLAKKALAEFTLATALDLAPHIAVNAVAPGPVLPPPGEGADYLADRAGPVPLGQRPGPDDIATAVLFLLRQRAVTGQIVFVDGGQHLLGTIT